MADNLTDIAKKVTDNKEIKNARVVCDRHGDITNASTILEYFTIKEGKVSEHHNIICNACVNEYLMKLQDQGEIGKITLQVIVDDKEEIKKSEEPIQRRAVEE